MPDWFLTAIAAWCVFSGFAMAAAIVMWAWENQRGFWPWFRRWNPVYLRSEIDVLTRCISEDRNLFDEDAANTAIERAYHQARLIRQGDIDPSREAARYSVKGHTLYIDATDRAASDPSLSATIPPDESSTLVPECD